MLGFPLHHGAQPRGERAALIALFPLALNIPLLFSFLYSFLPPCPFDPPGRLGRWAPRQARGRRDRRRERKLGLQIAVVFKLGLSLGFPPGARLSDRTFLDCGLLLAAGAVEPQGFSSGFSEDLAPGVSSKARVTTSPHMRMKVASEAITIVGSFFG